MMVSHDLIKRTEPQARSGHDLIKWTDFEVVDLLAYAPLVSASREKTWATRCSILGLPQAVASIRVAQQWTASTSNHPYEGSTANTV